MRNFTVTTFFLLWSGFFLIFILGVVIFFRPRAAAPLLDHLHTTSVNQELHDDVHHVTCWTTDHGGISCLPDRELQK